MGRQSRTKASRSSTTASERDDRPRSKAAGAIPTRWVIAAGLVLLTLAVFWQTRNHQYLNFDDDLYITNNPVVQRGLTADGITWAIRDMSVNWHPTTWLTYLAEVELFGIDPAATHLVNVGFHLGSTLLLFALLAGMTGAVWRSAIVAALFAIHPLRAESVAWISERKDVVSCFLFLVTLWLYVRWTRNGSRALYALALAAFALGLMAKQMLVTLPFVLLLLDYWPLRRIDLRDRPTLLRRLAEKIPFFVVTGAGVSMALAGQKAIGAVQEAVPLGTRIPNAILAYGRYLWKTIVPTDLAIPYPYEPVDVGAVLLSLLVVGGISAMAFVLRDRQRWLFTGWFWFVGTLVPVIGLVQIGGQSMADRYTYIPHIGLLTAMVWGVSELTGTAGARRAAAFAAAVVIGLFAVLGHRQVAVWRDSETLFAHGLDKTGNNFVASLQIANALRDRAEYAQALEHFRTAHRLNPGAREAREGVASTLIELAKLDRARGDDQAAMTRLQEAASISPEDKTRAAVALAQNDPATAIELYGRQIAQARGAAEQARAHNDLGAALASAGRDEEAVAEYRKAIELAPRQFDARMNLGALLSRMNRNDQAVVEFEAAASIQPHSAEPHVYLALAWQLMGRYGEALNAARRAWTLDPRASNVKLTTAVRMPYKETNFQEFIAFLERKAAGG